MGGSIRWVATMPLSVTKVDNLLRALALPGLVAYGFAVSPGTGSGGLPCLWRLAFGLDCPGCGLSRATALLVRGEILDALAMNCLVVPVVLAAGYCFCHEVVNHFRERRRAWPS